MSSNTSHAFISKNASNGASNNPFDLTTQGSGTQLRPVRAKGSSVYCSYYTSASAGIGAWHHIAVVATNGNIETVPTFYIDGVDAGSVVTETCGGTGLATGSGHDI